MEITRYQLMHDYLMMNRPGTSVYELETPVSKREAVTLGLRATHERSDGCTIKVTKVSSDGRRVRVTVTEPRWGWRVSELPPTDIDRELGIISRGWPSKRSFQRK